MRQPLLLACSGTKLERPSPAIDLYRGVMYESYRAHVRGDVAPARGPVLLRLGMPACLLLDRLLRFGG